MQDQDGVTQCKQFAVHYMETHIWIANAIANALWGEAKGEHGWYLAGVIVVLSLLYFLLVLFVSFTLGTAKTWCVL